DVTDRWDKEAATFDRDMGPMEFYMGMNWLRKSMTRQAHGHVLEAAVGTGRNIKYYKPVLCESITMVDQSRKMVDVAYGKWKEYFPRAEDLAKVTFRHQSVIDDVKLPDPEGFDFVIQTMGLCSTPEPEALIRSLARMTKKDGGRILLLEHGRSKYDWLNRVLDKTAAPHADKHGCWWNKDIIKIVEDSGVDVVAISRYHLGTTYWIELKP
ncbi:S-adenosyl-L-methionine-dependent methyltransferase, partial [Pseudovirgaria hyperparasitica]